MGHESYITVGGGPRLSLYGSKWDAADQMREAPTVGEAALWKAIGGGRIRKWRTPIRVNRQQVIRGFIADFYLPSFRAIVEVDGSIHESDDQTKADDLRDSALAEVGYSILRMDDQLVVRDPAMAAEVVTFFAEQIDDVRGGRQVQRGGDWEYKGQDWSPLSWTFRSYGILRGSRIDPEHWFRITSDMGDGFPVEYGGSIDERDCHQLRYCTTGHCYERSLGNFQPTLPGFGS